DLGDVADERAVVGPGALVVDQIVDGAAVSDHLVGHSGVGVAQPHRCPGVGHRAAHVHRGRGGGLLAVGVGHGQLGGVVADAGVVVPRVGLGRHAAVTEVPQVGDATGLGAGE